MKPTLSPQRLHRKERTDGIRLILSNHKKELPKVDLMRVTDPMCSRQWVTVSNEDKKIISVGRIEKRGMNKWAIRDLVTDNMYRENGIASEVVTRLVDKAVKGGARTIESEVSYDNVPVKKIFEKLGFKEDERRRNTNEMTHYVLHPSKIEKKTIKSYTPSLYRF